MYFAAAASAGAQGAGSYTINTIAGSDWVGDGGLATSAILIQAQGMAADGAGNLYVADAGDHRVRKISAGGVIQTVAGTGVLGFSGDGGPALQAQLNSPYGLALDNQGNLYIADLGNARVRRVTPDGTIATIAGGGQLPAGGVNNGTLATMLQLIAPRNLAFDASGNLYVSDFGAGRVYQISPQGSLVAFAGTGVAGASGDNGAAIAAQLNHPAGLAFDAQGALYIADSANHLVRRVKQGLITSYARAATPTGLAFDGVGNLYIADTSAGDIAVIPAFSAASPSTIGVGALDVYFATGAGLYASTGTAVVAALAKVPAMVAGGGNLAHGDNGPANLARLNHPAGVSADAAGNFYIADHDNHRIRRVAPDGNITTVAGTGIAGNSGNGGAALAAELNQPSSVTVDASGNLYIADTGNAQIRKVTPDGKIAAATNLGLIAPVYAIADSSGKLYISDAGAGKILTAGSNGVPATLLSGLNSPRGLAFDGQGNLYFTDAGAARVAMLSPGGAVTSIGTGWNIPRGVAVDSSGDVWVADTGLQQVIEVGAAGGATVIAGSGTAGFSGDGGPAAAAQLGFPWDVAVTPTGVALIADLENNRIRTLTPPAEAAENTTAVPNGAASSPAPVAGNLTIVNAASFLPGPIAPGMLLWIGGSGISPAQIPDTTIAFGPDAGRIISADSSGIEVLAPSTIAGSASVPIEILYQSTVVASIPVAVANEAPGLFTSPGQAATNNQAAANNQDGSVNAQANPAARGSVVALYGTGLGIAGDPVSVSIGNYPAQVLYAGPAAAYPGLFQINVQVPSGYAPTGDLPVVVTVGTSPTQSGTLLWVD